MNEPNDPAEQQPAADECLTNARENLNQAERLFDESQGRNLDQVNAVVGIANAWTALGRALAQLEPEPFRGTYALTPAQLDALGLYVHESGEIRLITTPSPDDVDPRELAGWVRRRFDIHDNGVCSQNERCWVCALRRTTAAPDEKPDHVHSADCAHQWVRATEPCRECRQTQTRNQERCPVPCPEPGEWWVHHGQTRTLG